MLKKRKTFKNLSFKIVNLSVTKTADKFFFNKKKIVSSVRSGQRRYCKYLPSGPQSIHRVATAAVESCTVRKGRKSFLVWPEPGVSVPEFI